MRSLFSSFLIIAATLLSQQVQALHDPTRPTDPAEYFGSGVRSNSAWSLQSILSASDRRIAIINGTRVREGDVIGSAKVIRIDESTVVLNTGGQRFTLRLLPTTIKVSP
jgi:MSHA biogenesis protein MshK